MRALVCFLEEYFYVFLWCKYKVLWWFMKALPCSGLLEGIWGKLELQKVLSVLCPCYKMREVLFQIELSSFWTVLFSHSDSKGLNISKIVSVDNILGSRQTKMDGKSHKGKLQTELLFQQKLLRFISTRWAVLSPWLCSGLYTRSGTAALEWHREMWGQLPSASWLSDSTTSLSQRMWPTGLSWCIWMEQKNNTQIFLWCEMLCSHSYNSCSFDFTFFLTSSMAVVFAIFFMCVFQNGVIMFAFFQGLLVFRL